MFKKLRLKFIALAAASSFLVLSIIVLVLNVSLYYSTKSRLEDDAKTAYSLPLPLTKEEEKGGEKGLLTRYFVVTIEDGVYSFYGTMQFPFEEGRYEELAKEAFSSSRGSGFLDYLYYYRLSSKAVFLDAKSERDSLDSTLLISSLVALSSFLAITGATALSSKKVIKPYEDNYKAQRRFITDASHELKTPLAVLSANMELLSSQEENNRWILSSNKEIEAMRKLVDELLSLNKIEEVSSLKKESFDLSADLEEAADCYEAIAKQKKLAFERDIENRVSYVGNEETLLKLIGIMLDNAFKFVDEGGEVVIKLCESKKKILLSFENSVPTLDEEKLKRCFERFYTADESHSHQKGGYGIGLSIAQAIVEKHHGEIHLLTDPKKKRVRFEIVLK